MMSATKFSSGKNAALRRQARKKQTFDLVRDADSAARRPYLENAVPVRQPHPLTIRHKEILALICEGLSQKEIAGQLGLSVHTVQHHTKTIYKKLGIHNRVNAVARVFAEELLQANQSSMSRRVGGIYPGSKCCPLCGCEISLA